MTDFEYKPADPRPYDAQWQEWMLCRDTWGMYDITTHPGSREQQATGQQPQPVVQTKRSMAKYRR